MTIANLPYPQEKNRRIDVEFRKHESSFLIVNRSSVEGETGWIIDTIYHCKLSEMDQDMGDFFARTLQRYMRDSRDRGFEMGRQYIRDAFHEKVF